MTSGLVRLIGPLYGVRTGPPSHSPIEMLGVALANSGAPGFKEEERKDLFIRFVRELTRQHLKVLVELAPKPLPFDDSPQSRGEPLRDETASRLRWNRRPTLRPQDDDLLALQMLHAYGLVEENEFLKFMGLPKHPVPIA